MYECHITVNKPSMPSLIGQLEAIGELKGWKTSYIDGDPLLGKKIFFYFTSHHGKFDSIKQAMHKLEEFLKEKGIDVIRSKIEHILYDTKTGLY